VNDADPHRQHSGDVANGRPRILAWLKSRYSA
jgi:hypothetical protein